jgi:hypothetical protein
MSDIDLAETARRIHRLVRERDDAREIAVTLEQSVARALELLEGVNTGGWFSADELKEAVDEAKAVLRGADAED